MPTFERASYLRGKLAERSLREWELETGINRGTLSRILRGRSKLNMIAAQKLAKVAGCGLDELVGIIKPAAKPVRRSR